MSEKNYNIDIDIDVNDILGESLTHASKCQYYGDRLADAIFERDQLKSNLKLVEAELGDKLMREWGNYYESKPSEALRYGWVIQQDSYKIALDKYHVSEHNVNLLKSADKAFDARGYSLGNITTVLVSGFSSAPKINKTIRRNEELKKAKITLKRPIGKRN